MTKTKNFSNRVYFTVFLVSCAALMFEISLTRIFSIHLSYHFAFMIISIAMLGIGSAGTLLSIYPKLKNISNINLYAVLTGISIIVCYIVSNRIPFEPVELLWNRMQVFYVALYYLVLSIPFFFAGILIVTAFSMLSEKSGLIYGSDLLGAGLGSLAVIGLLNFAAPEYSVLTASTICFIAAFVIGGKKTRLFTPVLAAIILLLFFIHPDFINVRISPYKSLSLALKYPGAEHLKTYYNSFSRIDTLKSPAVRFAPGLSLSYLEPLPEQIGISVDGDELNAVTNADDKNKLKFLEFLVSALVYEIRGKNSSQDVLVLDPKGGLQVLMAEHYRAETIHKVGSNPLLAKVIRNDFGEFSGGIYEQNIWAGLGRSWLHSSPRKVPNHRDSGAGRTLMYDVIDLSMTGASVSSTFGISEDYRFTVEAFEKYIGALKKEGVLSISFYLIPPSRTELRILGTVVTALEQKGIKDVSEHIAAIRSWDSMVILVKNSVFNNEEISRIRAFAEDRRFDLVHYPGIKQKETNLYIKLKSNEYFKAFKNLLNSKTRHLFVSNYLFDIKPVNDENPFFHYYLKLKNIKAIHKVMGGKWQYFIEEGYILPVVFVQVFILSFILILLPVFLKTGKKTPMGFVSKNQSERSKSLKLSTFLYFAMLGAGFMFVEITIIHKSILSLENPAYAVATVLTAILVSSGIGSLLSSKFPKLTTPYLLLALCGLIFAYSFALPHLLNFISPYSLELKIPMAFIALMPLGFFMGIPFPMGIKLLGQRDETLIPWAWAINGCLSVLAPILTIMLAMATGFRTVLWLGALAYLFAFISLKKLGKN